VYVNVGLRMTKELIIPVTVEARREITMRGRKGDTENEPD
jgi:hypothetical protein